MTLPRNPDGRIPADPALEADRTELADPIPDDVSGPIHVTTQGDNWKAGFAGSDVVIAVTPTKAEALERAKSIATERELAVVVHRKDGSIQKRLSF